MATQPRLLSPSFHLDHRSREAGRRGLLKARAALAEAQARLVTTDDDVSADRAHGRAGGNHDDHATAA